MNLEQFLDQERGAGSARGQGSFTIALEKARLKLQKYLLGSREEWVRKLIQAVSGWRVRCLEVKQTRFHTVLHFEPSLRYGLPSGQSILNTLLAADVDGKDPLNRFCQALHSARELESLSYYLAINDGKQRTVYHEGPHIRSKPSKKCPMAIFSDLTGLTLGISHQTDKEKKSWNPWSGGSDSAKRVMADLAQEFAKAALSTPVPIRLDGRPQEYLPVGPEQFLVALTGVELVRRGDPRFVLHPYLFDFLEHDPMSKLIDMVGPALSPGLEKDYAGLLVLVLSEQPKPSILKFVDDGAVLEELNLPSTKYLSYQVLLNAQGLPTDIGGLSLPSSPQRKERLFGALQNVAGFTEDLRQRAAALFTSDWPLTREQFEFELEELVKKPLYVRE
jgi:hypothetical protein